MMVSVSKGPKQLRSRPDRSAPLELSQAVTPLAEIAKP